MNRVLAGAALGAFIAALIAIVVGSVTSGGSSSPETTGVAVPTVTQPTRRTTTAARPKEVTVKLSAVGAYDPEGDRHENDDLAPLAVDGDPATFWKTEHYTHGFFKKGVGLVLDAGARRSLSKVVVGTDGSGSRAQIQLGANPNGPFHAVSPARALTGSTAFALKAGSAGRYVVVWVTALPAAIGEAHVTEVRAVAGY